MVKKLRTYASLLNEYGKDDYGYLLVGKEGFNSRMEYLLGTSQDCIPCLDAYEMGGIIITEHHSKYLFVEGRDGNA